MLEKIKAEIEQIEPYDLPCDKRTPEHIKDMALEIVEKYAEQEPTTRQSCENCKILEMLVGFELEYICEDDDKDFEYCENYCHFKAPTKECYLHWAEHKRKAVSK
jgi:hypothetical protein